MMRERTELNLPLAITAPRHGSQQWIIQTPWQWILQGIIGHRAGDFTDTPLTHLIVGVDAECDGGGLMADYGLIEIGWIE